MIRKFDEHLKFNLPEGYKTGKAENDDGDSVFQITAGEKKDRNGNKTSEFTANVSFREGVDLQNVDDPYVLK